MKGWCRFCYPLNSKNFALVLKETKNFYVIPSIGPIVEGYLLICSKKHFPSCGNLPIKLYPEFEKLKREVQRVFLKVYQGFTFFEHGKTKACAHNGNDAHCFHAHLHALPTDIDILEVLTKNLGKPIRISSLKEIPNYLQDSPYLYYEIRENKYLWSAPIDLRQQFFRWLIAEKLGIPQKADWKLNPDWEGTYKTYSNLHHYFIQTQW